MLFSFFRRLKTVAFHVVLLSAPCVGLAGTTAVYTDGPKALFSVEVPDFWSLRTGGLRDLEGPDADDIRDVSRLFGMTPNGHEGVWVGVIAPHDVSTLGEAKAYLQDIAPFLVQDAIVSPSEPRRVGGLPASSLKGRGHRNGKSIDFTVLAIDLPSDRIAIAVVIFEAGADLDPLGDINAMLASIRAIR
ncbi:MAG: hypothetical protein ABJG75_08845 [Roseobacter sp.]